jgi:6-pyruvoyltetrahydropterin/6-carboxytetrahydropterin synthase
MLLNFRDVKQILEQRVLRPLRDHPLDPDLDGGPATLERLARHLRERLASCYRPHGAELERVRLYLNRRTWVDDQGDPSMELTRTYEFAASHRLFTPALDEAANLATYGKCAHPSGHGHNYLLGVTVGGAPDPATGLVVSGPQLDLVVEEVVLSRLDHTRLGSDQPDLFEDRVPTAENICIVIWPRLAPRVASLGVQLVRLRLEETRDSAVEYAGPDPLA